MSADWLVGHAVHRGVSAHADIHDAGEVPVHRLPIPELSRGPQTDALLPDHHLVSRLRHRRHPILGQADVWELLRPKRSLLSTALRSNGEAWSENILNSNIPW